MEDIKLYCHTIDIDQHIDSCRINGSYKDCRYGLWDGQDDYINECKCESAD